MIAGMQLWGDALQTSYNHTVGPRYSLNRKYLLLPPVVNGQTEHARMDLVFNLNGSVTYLDVSSVAPFSCSPSLVSAANTKPGHTAKRAEKNKFDRYPHINLVPFILETTSRPGPSLPSLCSSARRNPTNIIAAACGKFHAVLLQEASDHVPHISEQFLVCTGDTDLAILFSKDTF